MKNANLDTLSSGLKIASLTSPTPAPKALGGNGNSISIPTIVVTPSPGPSFSYPSFPTSNTWDNSGEDSSYYGGGSGSGTPGNSTQPPANKPTV